MNLFLDLEKIFNVIKHGDLSPQKYTKILRLCNDVLGLKYILLYKLDISLSQYILISDQNIPPNTKKEYLFDESQKISKKNIFLITDFNNMPIGWIQIDELVNLDNLRSAFIKSVCEILSSEFENDWVNNLFTKIITPVKLSLSEKDYYYEICKVVGEASSVKFAAIRKYDKDDDALHCLAIYGRDIDTENLPLNEFSFYSDNNLFKIFHDVMNGPFETCNVFNHKDEPLISQITEFGLFHGVKTIIIAPLVVGGDSLGTVSFGVEHVMDFTNTQKKGFVSISNIVGAAISNYIETNIAMDFQRDVFDKFRSAVNEEVLHGLRHSIKNSLHHLYGEIKFLENNIKKKKYNSLEEKLSEIISIYSSAMNAVSAQASISSTSTPEYKTQDIVSVFESAIELVKHTLTNNQINVKYPTGQKFLAYIDANSLKYAFLNLLLNSVDSLKKQPIRGRKIGLNINSLDDRYKIIFSDTGKGFIPKPPDVTSPRDIWVPGKTTKKGGTGYGLPYVRLVIQKNHMGSINIFERTESKGDSGMAFIIELFKDYREKFK